MSKQLTDEWGTPDSIFKLLPSGSYFDPCPSFDQPKTFVKNNTLLSVTRMHPDLGFVDGLTAPWNPLNFVNPPFSDIGKWIEKANYEYDKFRAFSVVVIPDHTDQKWYRRYVQPRHRGNVVWIGRQKFIPLNGQKTSQPRFGTGLLMIGFDQFVVSSIVTSVRPS